MNRQQFMKELESLLVDIAAEERTEALQYYEDYFEDAGVDKEAEVIAELGSPAKVAKSIQMEMSQNNERGEFTERGYHSGDEANPFEVMDTKDIKDDLNENKSSIIEDNKVLLENAQKDTRNQESNFSDNREHNGNQFHHGNTKQNQNWNNQKQGQYNQNWNNHNWNNQSQNANQYNNGYTRGNYQQSSYQNQGNRDYEAPRKKGLSVGAIILICIFAIPVGLPVLCAVFGVFIGLGATAFGLVIGFGAAAFACILSGVVLFILGLVNIFIVPVAGMLLLGGGLLVFGIGLLFALLTTGCVKIIPSLVRGFVGICKAPFKMGGVAA